MNLLILERNNLYQFIMKKSDIFILIFIILIFFELISGYIQYQYFLKEALGNYQPVIIKLIKFFTKIIF